jgi:hypothetical protein
MENKNTQPGSTFKGMIARLEAVLDEYMVKKAPFTLPLEWKEFLVQISPYLVIISVILSLQAILGITKMSTLADPLGMMRGYGWGWGAVISLIATFFALVLQAKALPGLFKRTHEAWRLVFFASIVLCVGSLLALHFFNGLIGALIGWYILFQVKELYKH